MADYTDWFEEYRKRKEAELSGAFNNNINAATTNLGNVLTGPQAPKGVSATPALPQLQTPQTSPVQMGPTVAATMNQAPGNPLNGQGLVRGPQSQNMAQPTVPQTPAGPVNPAVAQPQPFNPTQADLAYNQQTASRESGGQNLGLHAPGVSTAQGIYGITQPAFKDIQKADPYFQGKQLGQLTPDEQGRANLVYKSVLGKQLQANGVEPTNANLQAAHFLGAKGLSNFLTTGAISPAAAQANGGEDKVRSITTAILQGDKNVKASGAALMDIHQIANGMNDIGNDPKRLTAIAYDDNQPEAARRIATATLANQIQHSAKMDQVQAPVENALAEGNWNAIQKMMNREQSQGEGSYIKAYLLNRLGFESAAKQEMEKLNPTLTTSSMSVGGQNFAIRTDTSGNIRDAFDERGIRQSPEMIAKLQANVMSNAQANPASSQRVRDSQGTEWSMVPTTAGMKFYRNDGTQGVPTGKTTPIAVGSDIDLHRQKALITLQGQFARMNASERMKAFESTNKLLVENGYQPLTLGEMGVDNSGNQLGAQPTQQVAPTMPTAPVAPTAPANVPVAPQAPINPAQPAGARPTAQQLKANAQASKEVAKEAAKVVAASPDTQNLIKDINKSIDLVNSKNVNIGPSGSFLNPSGQANQMPGEKTLGKFFGTEDYRNTKTVFDTVNKLAADGLKSLGSNPSTTDLHFWTANKPQVGDPPEFVVSWLESRRDDLIRRMAAHQTQFNAGGTAGIAPTVPTPTHNAPATDDIAALAAAELERRKKGKK